MTLPFGVDPCLVVEIEKAHQCACGIWTFRSSWTPYGCFAAQWGQTIDMVPPPANAIETFSSQASTGIGC